VDPPVVLRLVDRGSVGSLELRDSVADRGILNPILVRPSTRFPGCYDVADGLYRTAAASEMRGSWRPYRRGACKRARQALWHFCLLTITKGQKRRNFSAD
jgi:hypothetical protein